MPTEAVTRWLREHADPLTDLGFDPEQLGELGPEPLRLAVADALVVGLGEATHGTSEFFVLRARLVRHLVTHFGFTVVALEASTTACAAIDAYVTEGTGDPQSALIATGYWTWCTEEMVGMLEWLRSHNACLDPGDRVHLVGLDPVVEPESIDRVTTYVARWSPDRSSPLRQALERIRSAQQRTGSIESMLASAAASRLPGGRTRQQRAAAPVVDAGRVVAAALTWLRSSAPDPADTAAHLQVIDQLEIAQRAAAIEAEATLSAASSGIRDRAMADRVTDLLTVNGGRIVVWAHNGHVAGTLLGRGAPSLGRLLRARLGERYYAVGLLFATGCFQAMSGTATSNEGPAEFCVGAPLLSGLEAQLIADGLGDQIVDLRPARARDSPTEVRRWADRATRMRSFGAVIGWWTVLKRTTVSVRPGREYDALALVERGTRAHPIREQTTELAATVGEEGDQAATRADPATVADESPDVAPGQIGRASR